MQDVANALTDASLTDARQRRLIALVTARNALRQGEHGQSPDAADS